MRLLIYLVLVLLTKTACGGSDGGEHVHFKIYVPEIIKHHVHTKTILVHLHKPPFKKEPPKKKKVPKTYHKEEHHENWSFWNSYGKDHEDEQNTDHEPAKDHRNPKHQSQQDRKHFQKFSPLASHEEQDRKNINKLIPKEMNASHRQKDTQQVQPYNYHRGPQSPRSNFIEDERRFEQQGRNPDGTVGYPYSPQYAVHEDVNDVLPNDVESGGYNYEKGYRKGLHSETEHVYSDQSSQFYDDQHEEQNQSIEGYKDEYDGRTHAGRYFAEDTEDEDDSREDADRRAGRTYVT